MEGPALDERNDIVTGTVLRALRLQAGLTQRSVALRLGVTPQYVSMLELMAMPPSTAARRYLGALPTIRTMERRTL